MRLHDLTREIETQARSWCLTRRRLLAASKLLEDQIHILRGQAGTAVGHLDANPVAYLVHAKLNGCAGRRVLGGIVEQIVQDLAHPLGITPDPQIEHIRHRKWAVTERRSAESHGALEENAERNPMWIHREVLTLGF